MKNIIGVLKSLLGLTPNREPPPSYLDTVRAYKEAIRADLIRKFGQVNPDQDRLLKETHSLMMLEAQEREWLMADGQMSTIIPVILESPFAGQTAAETERNIRYARFCLRDSLLRNESPLASHLLYTQDGVLDDKIPEERTRGIEAGLRWVEFSHKTVVYTDYGISRGMQAGIDRATKAGKPVEYRQLPSAGSVNEGC